MSPKKIYFSNSYCPFFKKVSYKYHICVPDEHCPQRPETGQLGVGQKNKSSYTDKFLSWQTLRKRSRKTERPVRISRLYFP